MLQGKYYENMRFSLFSRYGLIHECEVSLPQKASLVCKAERFLELRKMKEKWNLKVSPYGFALLDASPWNLLTTDFINPFTRFYLEGYLQTVLASDISHIVYNSLVNNITEKEMGHNYNYRILSKYFEMAAKLGGVSILFFCICVLNALILSNTVS